MKKLNVVGKGLTTLDGIDLTLLAVTHLYCNNNQLIVLPELPQTIIDYYIVIIIN